VINNFTFILPNLGNQTSVRACFERLGLTETQKVKKDTVVVINGVGHIDQILESLDNKADIISEHLSNGGTAVGICLGMQAFMRWNKESKTGRGIPWYEGNVIKISLGLNVGFKNLFGEHDKTRVYFQNLYGLLDTSFDTSVTSKQLYKVGETTYVAAFSDNNFHGFQYHPELSGASGLHILKKTLGI